ncbi:MAG: hypothetical protein PHY12_03980 [Eubacteriales bacterium]|nr:hypothetical protein [Eubacteriales bacterium]
MQAIMETLFDVVYLTTVVTLGVLMMRQSKGRKQYLLFGIMAVTLGCGDAFHLVPRAFALCTDGLANHVAALGIGKLITSITMTAFYVLLYHVWQERYRQGSAKLTAAIYALAVLRVALCLMPQNGWTSAHPSLAWAIWRNVPFALLGLLMIVLFARSGKTDAPMRWLWLTIVISFACYLPVVLFADAVPAVGILMIPKTCAYVWTVLIGYRAMKGDK